MAKGKERAKAPRAAKPAAARAPAARPGAAAEHRGTNSAGTRAELSPEDVYRLIQETAYFKAKARGFEPGGEVQDWIEAEAEVRRRLDSRA